MVIKRGWMTSVVIDKGARGSIKAIYRKKDDTLYGTSIAGRGVSFSGPYFDWAPKKKKPGQKSFRSWLKGETTC